MVSGDLPKKCWRDVGAILRLVVLILTVDRFGHDFEEGALRVFGEKKFVPARSPDNLDDIPPGAAELRFKFLNYLAIAAHRPIETLQIAVDDKDQIVEFLPCSEMKWPQRISARPSCRRRGKPTPYEGPCQRSPARAGT